MVVITDEVSVLEVDACDGQHGLPVPLVEPVNGAAVDEGRIHTTTLTELAACRTHRQHNVEVLLQSLQVNIQCEPHITLLNMV